MFACFTVSLLQNCSSVHLASNILKLDWDAVDLIMKRGVERGLLRRKPDNVLHVGMDEKSFRLAIGTLQYSMIWTEAECLL